MKIKILFVCLGNICRSPAAHGIMETLIEKEHLFHHYTIDSCGTGGWHAGDLPDSRMRMHALQRDYHLTHKARQFRSSDFEEFDYIITMDDSNYTDVKLMASSVEDETKIHRMAEFISHPRYDHIPDPYYEGSKGFELVLDLLEDGCSSLLLQMEQRRKSL